MTKHYQSTTEGNDGNPRRTDTVDAHSSETPFAWLPGGCRPAASARRAGPGYGLAAQVSPLTTGDLKLGTSSGQRSYPQRASPAEEACAAGS
ncbi:hypothetical protein GGTG_03035 [Gaeumannomyces tritici R3-111a-1]|uniref:Uncharacterized protein n=1 Tax=Gaeumannomyces tritici (strain R3-111a-1) TaxID=644352 RepID=J3NP29_GAET3|nr:hypothetical protein GGTG_03035 [Gaeumannomyces tritici R3-111a-1]EJT77932.1 hypothetical protein GGTG_03035 [Gaeumannomyces tritici R3-111a-1]